jgi:2-hydroxy-3-oxopropionate reductase
MGEPMARNALAAGFAVTVHSRSPAPVERLVAAGAARSETPREATRDSDVLIITVPDTPDLAAVMSGADGVIAGAHRDLVVVDCGTHDPATMGGYAEALRALGADFLDAPMSGGEAGAKEGSLSLMVGGAQAALERARPLLQSVGRTIVHLGPVGTGQVAKACNQLVVAAAIEALAEAHTLASRAGLDPAAVFRALGGGLAASRVLELNGPRMLSGDYRPGGRAWFHLKDLRIARSIAASEGLVLPLLDLVTGAFERLIEAGGAELDHSALLTLLQTERPGPDSG